MIENTTQLFFASHHTFTIIIFGFLGAAFGSFAGVIISRMPEGQSIVFPSSRCDACQKKLKAWHNIPIVSWLFLRGRCAFCQHPIGLRPLILEIVCGLAFIALFYRYGFSITYIEKSMFFFLLICLAYIDLDTYTLPLSLLAFLAFLGLLYSMIFFYMPSFYDPLPQFDNFLKHLVFAKNNLFSLQDRILGALLGASFLLIINYIATIILRRTKRLTKEQWAMGFGDAIFIFALGLFVGLSHLFLLIFLASFFGSIIGIIDRIKPSKKVLDEDIALGAIPFGPFLALAAIFIYLR
jgi:leader peptidase (prepilin peptidase)/N-methyltransferase